MIQLISINRNKQEKVEAENLNRYEAFKLKRIKENNVGFDKFGPKARYEVRKKETNENLDFDLLGEENIVCNN